MATDDPKGCIPLTVDAPVVVSGRRVLIHRDFSATARDGDRRAPRFRRLGCLCKWLRKDSLLSDFVDLPSK